VDSYRKTTEAILEHVTGSLFLWEKRNGRL